ncbi:MAG: ethanolamine ammonia-lyase subunit EutC [Ilumatobacter sp.]|uniref:ethanolamine ammonia-lyase subunit EutC n=1 Tax=Ilumatobacter sp. TaxID=1967498 RepID=UPI00391A2032
MTRDDPPTEGSAVSLGPVASRADARHAASEVTAARLFLDGPGTSYSTADLLRLRGDHAAAQDAVHAELTIEDPGVRRIVDRLGLFGVSTRATTRAEYLTNPDLGRSLDDHARGEIVSSCEHDTDLQVAMGDGLSPRAVARYGADVLEALHESALDRGWTIGRPFLVSQCRVGVLNDIGDLLRPSVVVLLIGERPGLQTAQSMSAYMAYRPAAGHTDADRNLVCNIHDRGTTPAIAVTRVMDLAEQMRATAASGISLKEQLGPRPPALEG